MRQWFDSVFEETCVLSFTRTDLVGDRSWTIRRTIVANVRAYFRAKYLQYTRGRFFRFTSIVRENGKCTKYTANDAVEDGRGKSTRVVETAKFEVSGIDRGLRGKRRNGVIQCSTIIHRNVWILKGSSHLCLGVKSKITIARSEYPISSCFFSLSLSLFLSSSLLSLFLLRGS